MSVHPHNEFDKQFANYKPGQLAAVVNAASAHTQKLDTSGGAKLSDGDLSGMKIAHAGLKAMVAAGSAQGLDQPAAKGSSVGGFLLGQVRDAALTSVATAVNPALGLMVGSIAMAGQITSMSRSAASMLPHHSSAPVQQNTRNFRPTVHNASEGYFDGGASRKGSHHIGGKSVATASAGSSFAEQSDVVRGITPARGAGKSSPAVARENVFESAFGQMKFTPEQHLNNMRNLAKVEQQMGNTNALISGNGMDAKQEGVLSDGAWSRMDSGHKRDVVRSDGMMSLADTGTVSKKAIKSFTEHQVKPAQFPALTMGMG